MKCEICQSDYQLCNPGAVSAFPSHPFRRQRYQYDEKNNPPEHQDRLKPTSITLMLELLSVSYFQPQLNETFISVWQRSLIVLRNTGIQTVGFLLFVHVPMILRDFPIHPFSPLTLCSIAVAMINVGLFMTVTADRSYFLDVIKDRDLC